MEKVTLVARVLRETEKALLVSVQMVEPDPVGYGGVEFEREAWLPKSQMGILDTAFPVATDADGVGIQFTLPLWLARQKGLDIRPPFRNARQQVSVTLWHGRYSARSEG